MNGGRLAVSRLLAVGIYLKRLQIQFSIVETESIEEIKALIVDCGQEIENRAEPEVEENWAIQSLTRQPYLLLLLEQPYGELSYVE